ncbi:MAG: hypothetical protein ACREMA_03920, partial [Longimicrobiales bacterium]
MNSSYQIILLKRGLGFWLGVRLILLGLVGLMIVLGPLPGEYQATTITYVLMVVQSIIMAAITTGLVLFDARLAGEDLLLANLGVSRLRMALPIALLAGTLESLVLTLWWLN